MTLWLVTGSKHPELPLLFHDLYGCARSRASPRAAARQITCYNVAISNFKQELAADIKAFANVTELNNVITFIVRYSFRRLLISPNA